MIMDTFYYETITPYRLPFNQPVYCLQIPLGKVIYKKYTILEYQQRYPIGGSV